MFVADVSLPSFSIIVPTYQRRELACAALRALSEIRYKGAVEIIVVIDGSSDGTASALAQLDLAYSLQIVEQENRGLAAARNVGAAHSSNEILLFLDDDMICEPDVLEQHAKTYSSGADAVIGDIPLHPSSPPGILSESFATAATWVRSSPPGPFDICGGHLSIKKEAFKVLGGFDEQFCSGGKYGDEDVEFGIRLTERFRVQHNPEALSWQVNAVSAHEFMRRARQLALADMRLVEKHPAIRGKLFELRRAWSPATKMLYWPVSTLPLIPELLAAFAVGVCEVALRTQFRSSTLLARFFAAARSISYWSALRRHADPTTLRMLAHPNGGSVQPTSLRSRPGQ